MPSPGTLFPDPPALQVISASRRTDLARCFPGELAGWLAAGRVAVRNPYNGRTREVDLRPAAVHTLVLWSKDYSRVLADEHGLAKRLRAYEQAVFHFTVTGLGGGPWEPGVCPPEQAARQFAPLAGLAGDPRRVIWRFDPLLFWRAGRAVASALPVFDRLAEAAARAGVARVMVSLYQDYARARRRAALAGLAALAPRPGRLRALAAWLANRARVHGLEIAACAGPELAAAGLPAARCVDGEWLARLHPRGLPAPGGKDPGQRPACGCTPSVDIGDYALACPRGCVYCYARPRA